MGVYLFNADVLIPVLLKDAEIKHCGSKLFHRGNGKRHDCRL